MGVFDGLKTISNALAGQPTSGSGTVSKPVSQDPLNKVGYNKAAMTQPDSVKAAYAKQYEQAAAKAKPAGVDAAMSAHADKVHPVGARKSGGY
jgi:hypothetical protein